MATGILVAAPGAAEQIPRDGSVAAGPSGAGLPANIPVKREVSVQASPDTGDYAWMTILVLGAVMGCGVLVMRRKAGKGVQGSGRVSACGSVLGGLLNAVPSQEIQRISSTRLTPRHSLHVVVWGGRRLLIGCSENAIELMAEGTAAAAATVETLP